jgi:hypothetical protein
MAMSASLSYLSTLEELISTADETLQQDFGYLAPETVINYVMYLRNQLRTAERDKEAAEAQLVTLEGLISTLDKRLAEFMSRLGANNTLSSCSSPTPPSTSFAPARSTS